LRALPPLLVGAGVFLIYSLTRKSIGLSTLLFYADKVKSFRFDGLTPVMVFGLRVQNTSSQPFVLKSFAADLSSNGYLIGNASSFIQQVVPANSQVVLNIEARLMLIGIVNDIIKAFQSKDFTFDIEMQGYANVDNIQFPVTANYKVGL
jgi:LEA14-like dessication related protein